MLEIRTQQNVIGLIVSFVIICSGPGSFAGTVTYTYDNKGQVTRSEHQDGPVIEYSYDNIGNRATMTAASSALNLALVASYPFSEGSGGTTADASGNGHDGTLMNGVAWTTNGKVGNALSFDGVDDYVEIADASALRLGTTQTIAGWVNLIQLPSDWVRIIGKGDLSYRNYGVWLSPSGTILYQIVFSDGWWSTTLMASTTQLSAGIWYHIAATYDGTRMRLYINGQEEASAEYAKTPSVSGDPLTLGYAGYHTYFNGKLDEVKIYDRALSASEIQNLANP